MGRYSVPAPTIISIIINTIVTLIINISTLSLIHTGGTNDIQYSIYMVVTTALPVYRIMLMLYWISLTLPVWMRLMVFMLMMNVLIFMTMMMILMMILTMILIMVSPGTEDRSQEEPNSYLR